MRAPRPRDPSSQRLQVRGGDPGGLPCALQIALLVLGQVGHDLAQGARVAGELVDVGAYEREEQHQVVDRSGDQVHVPFGGHQEHGRPLPGEARTRAPHDQVVDLLRGLVLVALLGIAAPVVARAEQEERLAPPPGDGERRLAPRGPGGGDPALGAAGGDVALE